MKDRRIIKKRFRKMGMDRKRLQSINEAIANMMISWTEGGISRTGHVKGIDWKDLKIIVLTDKSRLKRINFEDVLF